MIKVLSGGHSLRILPWVWDFAGKKVEPIGWVLKEHDGLKYNPFYCRRCIIFVGRRRVLLRQFEDRGHIEIDKVLMWLFLIMSNLTYLIHTSCHVLGQLQFFSNVRKISTLKPLFVTFPHASTNTPKIMHAECQRQGVCLV